MITYSTNSSDTFVTWGPTSFIIFSYFNQTKSKNLDVLVLESLVLSLWKVPKPYSIPDYYTGPAIWSCRCSQVFWLMNLLLEGL